jgi:hypothetical protein
LQELINSIVEKKDDEYRFKLVQKMFLTQHEFDKGLIYMIRLITKNFIQTNCDRSINGLPIKLGSAADGDMEIEDYIKNVVMAM